MRTPLYKKSSKQGQVGLAYHMQPATGGLNKRDSITEMDEGDALLLDNAFPEANDVRVRRGFSNDYPFTASANAETLLVYNTPSGTDVLYASRPDIISIVGGGANGSATNGKFQFVNYTVAGGTSYLCAFNGVDSPLYFDGTNWISITGASTPAITGITTTDIIGVSVHKRRMWLTLNSSLKVWYLPVDAVGGAANAVDLGGIAMMGGYVMATGSFTRDAGDGIDDLWIAITSEGQLIAYQGTDPSSATTWELVGVWQIGQPIGRRCMHKFKGDLLIITTEGVASVGKVISGDTGDSAMITDKISGDYSAYAKAYSGVWGWDMMYYPKADMLLLNIPTALHTTSIQYAMNTNTGAWGGPFTGINSNCWTVFAGDAYFGKASAVCKFWNQDSDAGSDIEFDIQQAFSSLGYPGTIKKINAVRPFIKSTGAFTLNMKMNTNYQISQPDTPISSQTTTSSDDATGWGVTYSLYRDWEASGGVGSSAGLRIRGVVNNKELRYQACDVLFEAGGIIG